MDGSASMSRGRSDPLLTNLVSRTNSADTWMAFSTPAQHGTAQHSAARLVAAGLRQALRPDQNTHM